MRVFITLFALLAAVGMSYLSYRAGVGAQDPANPPSDRRAQLDAYQRIIGQCEKVIRGVEEGATLLIPFALESGDNVYTLEEFARMSSDERDRIKTSEVQLPITVEAVRQRLAAAKYSQESIDSFVRDARRVSQRQLDVWKNRRAAAFKAIDQFRSPPPDVDIDPIKSEEKKGSEAKPDEKKPDPRPEKKPDDTKPEEPKPAEKQPEPYRQEKNPPRTEFREEKKPEDKAPEPKKVETARPTAGADNLIIFIYADGNNPKPGTIEQLNRTTWIETTPKGVIYRYRETDRTKEYVELHDAGRGVSLRVFESKVMLRHPDLNGGDWQDWRKAKEDEVRPNGPSPIEKKTGSGNSEELNLDSEVRRLLGKWNYISLRIAGKEVPTQGLASPTFSLRRNSLIYTLHSDGKPIESYCKLDIKESPKQIYLESEMGRAALGIYKLDKDELTICISTAGEGGVAARPKDFVSDEKSNTALMVLVKAAEQDHAEAVPPQPRFEEKKAEEKKPDEKKAEEKKEEKP